MSTSTSLECQPKRVILRLRVDEFEGHVPSGYYDAIKAYLTFAGRSTSELEEKKHYAHIEPFQDPELRQTSFHITLDIEKDMLDDPNFQDLPHEIYRIRRDEQGKLQVKQFQNTHEEKNYLTRIRRHTDRLYPWAK